ncbi:MAG: hypothetical protein ACK5ME_09565 [Parahaliea sp.]
MQEDAFKGLFCLKQAFYPFLLEIVTACPHGQFGGRMTPGNLLTWQAFSRMNKRHMNVPPQAVSLREPCENQGISHISLIFRGGHQIVRGSSI